MEVAKTFLVMCTISNAVAGQFLSSKEHVTKHAGKLEDLWCYTCDTMEMDDRCVDLAGNHSSMIRKCADDRRICMVKRISYTTSTENSTSEPRMWALARNCTGKCEAGCIVVGERTKLYSCTACCEQSLCNVGTGGTGGQLAGVATLVAAAALVAVMTS